MKERQNEGRKPAAFLFTLPFWLMVEPDDRLEAIQTEWNGFRLIAYPPFRSGRMAFNGTPAVDATQVPPASIPPSVREGLAANATHLCSYPNIAETQHYRSGPDGKWTSYVYSIGKGHGAVQYGEPWSMATDDFLRCGFPMDSLRVDVLEKDEGNRGVAERFTQLLLTHLRVLSKQWWILRSISPLQGLLRGGAYLDDLTQELTSQMFGVSPLGRRFFGFERLIGASLWREAVHAISNKSPNTPRSLWLDSAWQAQGGTLGYAPITLCMALELAVEQRVGEAFSDRGKTPPKRSKLLKSEGLPGYVDRDCHRLLRRSLKVDHPETFKVIEELWRVRGHVAHGVEPPVGKEGEKRITFQDVGRYFSSASVVLSWLEQSA